MSDLIDRQAVIDVMSNMYKAAERWGQETKDCDIRAKARAELYMASLIEMKQRIEKLPSAQPDVSEKNVGKWIKMSDADGLYYCCSKCGEELYRKWSFDRRFDLFPKKESIDKTKYCSNCGVKMIY